ENAAGKRHQDRTGVICRLFVLERKLTGNRGICQLMLITVIIKILMKNMCYLLRNNSLFGIKTVS
ncbi:hypothetical protein, partial [Faecalibaculum rodentium]|uniref:hypothetical protein n=1 Tax=Faecalibaculum rodentium TaxID=1702221 RepID=UPI0023F080CC